MKNKLINDDDRKIITELMEKNPIELSIVEIKTIEMIISSLEIDIESKPDRSEEDIKFLRKLVEELKKFLSSSLTLKNTRSWIRYFVS